MYKGILEIIFTVMAYLINLKDYLFAAISIEQDLTSSPAEEWDFLFNVSSHFFLGLVIPVAFCGFFSLWSWSLLTCGFVINLSVILSVFSLSLCVAALTY